MKIHRHILLHLLFAFLCAASAMSYGVASPDSAGAPRTYYVDANASDNNNGLSSDAAWATIAKVNAATLDPGDTVLFKRGQAFDIANTHGLQPSCSGAAGNSITYGSYGTGALPIIHGGGWVLPNSTNAGSWADYTATVAKTWLILTIHSGVINDPGRLEIDGTEYWSATSAAGVNVTNRWFYGTIGGVAGRLLVYSPNGNPATAGLVIHQGAGYKPLQMRGVSYVTVQELEFQGGYNAGTIGVANGVPSSHIVVRDCRFGWLCAGSFNIPADSGVNNDHIELHHNVFDSGASNANVLPLEAGLYAGKDNYCNPDGIRVGGCDYVSIHHNTFRDWFHASIYLWDGNGGTVNYGEVYSNTMVNPNVAYCRGLATDGTADGKVSYNRLHDNIIRPGYKGVGNQINGDHNEVYNNVIDGITQPASYPSYEAGAAIQMQGYAGPCHHNIIRDNTITGCSGPGIHLCEDAHNTIHDNVIHGNTIIDCGKKNLHGSVDVAIKIDNYANVLGNTFTDNKITSRATNVIHYRGALHTVAAFNAHNGDNSDVITGNRGAR